MSRPRFHFSRRRIDRVSRCPWFVATALLAGCQGSGAGPAESEQRAPAPASEIQRSNRQAAAGSGDRQAELGSGAALGSSGGTASASGVGALVPKLPASPDGVAEIQALDRRVELHRGEPELEILLLLERASIRGGLEDYQEALQRSAAWVRRAPRQRTAWQTRAQVLTRVHEFAAARTALERLRRLVRDRDAGEGLAATIDEATGAGGAEYRERMARDYPDPTTLTQWAASLAAAGRLDDALAAMQRVPALIHDNPPELLSWVLFQWGRIYEQRGQVTAARTFYEAAHARLPTVESTVHLARAIAATGGDPGALVAGALAENRHPDLLALAGELAERGGGATAGAGAALIAEAARAWERYVAALPRAFAAQAARFYLGPGRRAARAYELARLDRRNRDTPEARALVAEAALAAGDAPAACAIAGSLAQGSLVHQLVAWRAYRACGRDDDAAALAARLGTR
jgi:tetratricopeptide (TPR) repeat protein